MRRIILAVGILAAAPAALPAEAPKLSRAVREFVTVDSPVVALVHASVIDGTGAAPAPDTTIVIRDGRIAQVGPSRSVRPPAGAAVLDLTGKSVIPGLVGMHDHLVYPIAASDRKPGVPALYGEMGFSFPRLYLACGVTSIRTTGALEAYTDLELEKLIDAGEEVGPKIHVTAPYLEGKGAFASQMHQLTGAEDARRTVDYWAQEGATSFKAYMHVTRDELSAAIRAAHARGLKLTGHLCSIGFREAAALGIDDLEHGLLVDTEFDPGKEPDVCPSQALTARTLSGIDVAGPAVAGTIRDLVAHRVAVTSTLPVFETFVANRPPLQDRLLEVLSSPARVDYLTGRARVAERKDSPWAALLAKEMQFERDFVRAGGLLLAGEDPTGYGGVVAGFGDQREVELLVEAGFTPVEAIRIATENGATFLGEADRIGTIAPGKDADLVVLGGNPAADIAAIEKVETVFKDGVGYDPARLIASVRGSVGLR